MADAGRPLSSTSRPLLTSTHSQAHLRALRAQKLAADPPPPEPAPTEEKQQQQPPQQPQQQPSIASLQRTRTPEESSNAREIIPRQASSQGPETANVPLRLRSSSILQALSRPFTFSAANPTITTSQDDDGTSGDRKQQAGPGAGAAALVAIAAAAAAAAAAPPPPPPVPVLTPAATLPIPGAASTGAAAAAAATALISPTRPVSAAAAAKPAPHPVTRPPPGKYMPFPPLQQPNEAPEVPIAPPSGMYWSRAPVSGHPHSAFRAHTTTMIGSNVYVFGGCDAKTCFNSMYVLDADSFYWSVPLMVGDIPTPLRAMTCTAVGRKLVVFGGGDGPTYYNDVYVLDTVSFRWTRPRIVGDRVPSKRRAHTACLYKNGIYVFGGGDGVRALNDIWRLDVGDATRMSWKLISPAEKPSPTGRDRRPKPRGYHTANMVGGKLIIYGGSDGGECFDDVWIYDMDKHAWKAAPIELTFRRLSHTATIVGSYLFVIGGHDGSEYCNDVLLLNLVTMTWDKRKVYGVAPSGRGYHGTVLYDSRLLMIGGFDGSEVYGDVIMLELAVHAYYSQISHFTIDV